MSFFSKQTPVAKPSSIKINSSLISKMTHKGDRIVVDRTKHEAQSVAESLHKNVDKLPNGCLFRIAGGFFDKDGYWCRRKSNHEVEVNRTSSRRIMKMLTAEQKDELLRVRNRAKRNGIR